MKIIEINSEFITLNQFLKLAKFISNGGEAKYWLEENNVLVDNQLDNRRGRKLYDGMIIEIKNEKFQIKRVVN